MASGQQLKRWAVKGLLKSTAGLLMGTVIAQMPAKIAAQETTPQEGAAPEILREAVEAEGLGESEGLQRGGRSPAAKIGTFTAGSCPFQIPPAIAAERFQCGFVTVPERHSQPDAGRVLKLGVVVLKGQSLEDRESENSDAENNNAELQPDPLVMVQGGPGGSMVELAPYFGPELATAPGFGANRDLILFDQRGTLHSEPFLFCDEVYQFRVDHARDPESPELREKLDRATVACRDRLTEDGVDLAAFNSVESAADVAMVVQALGYDEFNLYGVSYGTMLAQHVMRDHPERLRSVVLDSVAPLDISFVEAVPKNTDRVLRKFFEACEDSEPCNAAYPNLEAEFFEAIARLNEEPIEIKLPNVGAIEAAIARGTAIENLRFSDFLVPILFDGDALLLSLNVSFYSSQLIPSLPQAVHEAYRGNYSGLLRTLPTLVFSKSQADGVYNSVICSEDGGFDVDDVEVRGIRPELVETLRESPADVLRTCGVWQVPLLGDRVNRRVRSRIPTLLLSGDFDHITPPSFAARVARRLRRSYRYTFPHLGHALLGSDACVTLTIGRFLENPRQDPDPDCVDQELNFTVPVQPTMVPAVVHQGQVETLVPDGWSSGGDSNTWSELSDVGPTGRSLVFFSVPGTDEPVFLQNLLQSLPYKFLPSFTKELGDRQWTISVIDNPAQVSVVASTAIAGQVYFVALDTDTLWHRDAVLDEVLGNFQVVSPAGAQP
ncbi:MAG: alpha/beta fold hydrolase [Cyanobacteria bacterium P01_C01_bin.89]